VPPEWLVAGFVGRPHGLDGSFHVRAPRAPLLTVGRTLQVGGRSVSIDRRAGTDDRPILRIAGVSDRAAAAALGGEELRAPVADAPPLEEDEWYAADLEGCRVVDGSVAIGTVRRLLALPSCEVLEVDRPGVGDLLVPLVADAVRSVDLGERVIDVDLVFLGEGPQ
jgi:16S rRNA processing protein RimM